jgi:hypothetical protein
MPQSIMKLLIQLQEDLNNLTISCIEANGCVTDILSLYNGNQPRRATISRKVSNWSASLGAMSDALEKFQNDADMLGEYLDAQR